MNSDNITTVIGAIIGVLVAIGVVTADQAPILVKAGGIIIAALIGIWGHQTNKP